jgi:hypothetical protein
MKTLAIDGLLRGRGLSSKWPLPKVPDEFGKISSVTNICTHVTIQGGVNDLQLLRFTVFDMGLVMKGPVCIVVGIIALVTLAGAAAKDRPTQFWNLTLYTISEFYLAPAGTSNWGPNQCKNDRDGTVDADERLRITDVPAGIYDAKLTDVTGRTCIVRNIKIETGSIFSIEARDLKSCDPKQ